MRKLQSLKVFLSPTIIWTGVLSVVVLLALWLRLQGAGTLPPGQFTETDAYLFYHQAEIVSKHGSLPANDAQRWFPLGRDNSQTLNLYPTVLGYTHKILSAVFADVSLYKIVLFAPAICFCIGLAAICLFCYHTEGGGFALCVTTILATLPGTIERSAAGFADRDAWCLMLGVLAIITYLCARRTENDSKRLVWTLASGFLMFLGGISWEGFGIFLAIILSIELWQFLTTDTEDGLPYYALWVFCFAVPLYLTSPMYRGAAAEATHLISPIISNLSQIMLVPPLILLGIRALRHVLLRKTALASKPHLVSYGLMFGCLSLVLFAIWMQRDAFTAWRQNPLTNNVGELVPPDIGYWPFRYGSIFLMGSIGAAIAPVWHWGRTAHRLAYAIAAFALTAFFRQPLNALFGEGTGNAFFGIAVAACMLFGCRLAITINRSSTESSEKPKSSQHTMLAMLLWFFVWIALARGAKRFDFFIGIPLAFFTTTLCRDIATWLTDIARHPKYTTDAFREILSQQRLKNGIAAVLGIATLFWGPTGGHIGRSYLAATDLRHASPGNSELAYTLEWMKIHLPPSSVVAAEWSYGTQLNVLAGVKTIIDSDHYIPHWIHLYQDHVQSTNNEAEALEFLLTHGATHMMITHQQPENTLLRGNPNLSDAFIPRYPQDDFETANVRVWELNYPPNIKTSSIYLQTYLGTHPEVPPETSTEMQPETHEIHSETHSETSTETQPTH